MQPKITETIELTISYHPNGTDERVNLPDLLDVLHEGARAYLPFGCASVTWEIRAGVTSVSVA